MTVDELKRVLENLEDDMKVMVGAYSDYTIDNADTEIIYPENGKPFLRVF